MTCAEIIVQQQEFQNFQRHEKRIEHGDFPCVFSESEIRAQQIDQANAGKFQHDLVNGEYEQKREQWQEDSFLNNACCFGKEILHGVIKYGGFWTQRTR